MNNETELLKLTLTKQANRIANLTLDLDLAYAQIELLSKELAEKDDKNEVGE